MSISFEHAIDIARSPEEVFAVLDDVSQTPKWLAPCKGIERLTPGPSEVGSQFRYSYHDFGRSGTMDGVITARIPNQQLSVKYHDSMVEVLLDFRLSPTGTGTWLIHRIEVTTKTFFAGMFSPLIRSHLPKQTTTALDALRKLLEAGSEEVTPSNVAQ
ncbi:MAG: hypothetical protein JWM11_6563 [Planctomycetaceae bacterium]|nr:hypothetical protein [Planctomycetaceae bacterium]